MLIVGLNIGAQVEVHMPRQPDANGSQGEVRMLRYKLMNKVS